MDQRQVISTSNNGSASIELDVNELLKHVKNIFQVELEGESSREAFTVSYEKKISQQAFKVSYDKELIHKISNEIWCDCEEKGNAQEKAQSLLLNLLSNYSPDEKVVLVLAVFVVRYGDVMEIMNQQTNGKSGSNNRFNLLVSLKKLIIGTLPSKTTLLKLQTVMKHTVNSVLRVVHFIMELKGFHTWDNILSEIDIDNNICCMVTAVILCGFTVSKFYSGYSLILNEELELMDIQKKIQQYYEKLTTHFDFCRRREERTHYRKLSDMIEDRQASKIDILYYFISSRIDEKILYNHGSKEQTTLRSFEKNNVLILYSSLAIDTFQYEVSLLNRFYNNTNTKFGYKIVWMPIPDKDTTISKNSYMEIISKIQWCYTLTYEAVLKVNCGLVHLLEKDWGFRGKPMLVALDERGRMVCQNALLMLDLYGDDAFPFTTEHEKQLLTERSMGITLLLPDTDATLSRWKKSKEQYVCLYSGDNNKWCESMHESLQIFTEKETNIMVEKAYVRRNSHQEAKLEEHSMDYLTSTEIWKRLQKFVLHFSTQASSEISKKFLSWATFLLMLNKSSDSWVAIGNADNVVVFKGTIFLNGLNRIVGNIKEWKRTVTTDSFLEQLSKQFEDLNKEERNKDHCHKFEIDCSPALIKGDMCCPTCNELMQLTMMYKCCTTEN